MPSTGESSGAGLTGAAAASAGLVGTASDPVDDAAGLVGVAAPGVAARTEAVPRCGVVGGVP
ncbi:hypothetical protein HCA58_18255 [Micromonospora sp. HNM0581]|uniref:hypothetical protein n=1 Tax=Micromonospora sp. HNM0581 TaxID=2716341 RepID=UPI00146D0C1E|nr:hypothetical protein [Micromonospora sp. HNM0581]NLU80287.1 hypothetical protein [Micromonospora sp. HNM0581]